MRSHNRAACARRTTLAWAWFAALAAPAAAEIPDYMILRLLYLGTSCGVQHLEQLPPPQKGWQRFKAACRDVNAYPHGIFVTCKDPHDDRDCTIETQPKSFDSLELLRPKAEESE